MRSRKLDIARRVNRHINIKYPDMSQKYINGMNVAAISNKQHAAKTAAAV